jgi:hypothetical protein
VDDVHGVNATTGNGAVGDVAGHGTHLAGVIGAASNNQKGLAGIAWGAREVLDRLRYGSDPVPGLRGRCLTGARLNLRGALDPAPPPVWPITSLSSTGNRGGPLVPSSQEFVIWNRGSTPLEWSASTAETWLHLKPSGGTLGAGDQETVVAALSPAAATFARGSYSNRIEFVLTSGPSRIEVPWTLRIYEPAVVRVLAVAPPDRGIQVDLTGQPGTSYRVEATASFSSWRSMITNVVPPNGEATALWIDRGTNARLFFRARVLDPP